MKKRAVSFLLLLACLALSSWAEKVESIPNPRQQSGSFVADSAGVLGPEYIRLIDEVCQSLKAKTGAELAVVTVSDLDGLVIEDFAERLFKLWGIGEKSKDNGLLLLFSLSDRQVRIEVGYGLEGVIPDSKAGQLLDAHAVPKFRQGEYAQGLYQTALESAAAVAAAQNVALGISAPPVMPGQVAVPVGVVSTPSRRRVHSPLAIAGPILLGIWLAGLLATFLRYRFSRGYAARAKAIKSGNKYIALIWTLGFVGFFILLGAGSSFLSTLGIIPIQVGATWIQSLSRKLLRRRLERYRLSCASCHTPMEMVPEAEDNALLSPVEDAEEKAGGMDYEIWKCGQCGATAQFTMKLNKAQECPKCHRRTLKQKVETLVGATYSHGGRERVTWACRNPECDYKRQEERSTPAKSYTSSSSSSSSSSHSSSSSSSSFGGGHSGGGGASRSW